MYVSMILIYERSKVQTTNINPKQFVTSKSIKANTELKLSSKF